jgi:peptidoglycan-associated lipoprotein
MKRTFPCLVAALLLLCLPQCKSNYPRCDQNADCQSRGEVCVDGQCQECADTDHCREKYPQEGRTCVSGRCELPVQCQKDGDCASLGANLVCIAGACVAPCRIDADCLDAGHCINHRCVAKACSLDADCGTNQQCVEHLCKNNSAASKAAAACAPTQAGDLVRLDMVFFEFNKYDLTDAAREQLASVLDCLRQAPTSLHLVIEGHCDDRGTQEYNLALGEKRAYAVANFFKQMGWMGPHLSIRSKGENEPLCQESTPECYARNRRVQFIQSADRSL